MRSLTSVGLACLSMLLLTATTANAGFVEIDNFEDGFPSHPYELDGNASNSNGWEEGKHVTSGNEQIARVVDDPAGGTNRTLEIGLIGDSGDRDFHKDGFIANDATGTLFFRFHMTGDDPSVGIGMDDQQLETAPSDAGPWVNLTSANGIRGITVDGNGSSDTQEDLGTLTEDVWYSVWMVIDNDAKEYEVYIQGGAYGSQTQLTAPSTNPLIFRDSLSVDDDLNRVYIRANGANDDGTGASIFFDDIYLASGEDLSNPIPEPASLLLASWGLVAASLFRRRVVR